MFPDDDGGATPRRNATKRRLQLGPSYPPTFGERPSLSKCRPRPLWPTDIKVCRRTSRLKSILIVAFTFLELDSSAPPALATCVIVRFPNTLATGHSRQLGNLSRPKGTDGAWFWTSIKFTCVACKLDWYIYMWIHICQMHVKLCERPHEVDPLVLLMESMHEWVGMEETLMDFIRFQQNSR